MVSIHDRGTGGYGYDAQAEQPAPRLAQPLALGLLAPATLLMRKAGMATSVVLVLGVVVWGYRLAQRDLSGLPVIHAPQGPARIAPEDPGGDLARHVGLAVNEVAGSGMAAPAPQRVLLAPDPEALSNDDTVMSGVTSIPEVHHADPVLPEEAAPANQPTANVPQGTAIAVDDEAVPGDTPDEGGAGDGPTAAPVAAKPKGPVAIVPTPEQPFEISANSPDDRVPDSVPGLKVSPRPVSRPFAPLQAAKEAAPVAALTAAGAAAAAATDRKAAKADAAAPSGPAAEVDPDSLPVGTRVAQLGAFDSADIARTEWDRMAQKFPAQMAGKQRIVQESTSGGRKFFRLRVAGFDTLDASRSFCADLVAGGANCIPTVAR